MNKYHPTKFVSNTAKLLVIMCELEVHNSPEVSGKK